MTLRKLKKVLEIKPPNHPNKYFYILQSCDSFICVYTTDTGEHTKEYREKPNRPITYALVAAVEWWFMNILRQPVDDIWILNKQNQLTLFKRGVNGLFTIGAATGGLYFLLNIKLVHDFANRNLEEPLKHLLIAETSSRCSSGVRLEIHKLGKDRYSISHVGEPLTYSKMLETSTTEKGLKRKLTEEFGSDLSHIIRFKNLPCTGYAIFCTQNKGSEFKPEIHTEHKYSGHNLHFSGVYELLDHWLREFDVYDPVQPKPVQPETQTLNVKTGLTVVVSDTYLKNNIGDDEAIREIEQFLSDARLSKIEKLQMEYDAFLESHAWLAPLSADELLADMSQETTPFTTLIDWLTDFCERWREAEDDQNMR